MGDRKTPSFCVPLMNNEAHSHNLQMNNDNSPQPAGARPQDGLEAKHAA
jgi:hypothetical protein